jgi:hypothetical protein
MTDARRTHRKNFVVNITEEIINNAVQRDSSHCMIADAIKHDLGGKRVVVDIQTVRWTDEEKGLRYICLTPALGQRCILEFDQAIKPDPFGLSLYPMQIVKSGRRQPGEHRPKTVKPGRTYSPGAQRGTGSTTVKPPIVENGVVPPVGALSNFKGRRRTFGLRQGGLV